MAKMRKCIPGSRHIAVVAALLVFLSLSAPLFAQNSSLSERLSPDTLLYVEWRGSGSITSAEKENHVLQLMEDPALAPVWLGIASNMQKGMAKQGSATPAPKLADIVSLAANPMVFGIVENPNYSKTADKKTEPVGIFLVYDAKGKKEIIENLKALYRDPSKPGHTLTHYEFGGATVEEDAFAAEHNYSAQTGGYFLFANLKLEIEDLITRFRSDSKVATSVIDLPEHKETRKFVGANTAIEIFGRMPKFMKWIPDDPKTMPFVKSLENLHLDKIHAFGMGIGFAGAATQWRGALLADMSSGSIFDLLGESQTDFALQPLLIKNSNISENRFDWAAFYHAVHGAVDGNLTPQQAATLGAVEGMAQGYIGMSIPDALGLFSGELATTSSVGDDGSIQQVFATTIKKPQDVLRILRAVLGAKIVSEDTAGNTTYLNISYPGTDPPTKAQHRTLYYVAVGPTVLVAGKRKADVKGTIETLNTGGGKAPAAGLLADKEYLELRSKLPEKLSGFGAADYRQFPLDKVLANFMEQMNSVSSSSKSSTPPDVSWLKSMSTGVVTRHVHMWVSGTWKDSNGIYFASYFQ